MGTGAQHSVSVTGIAVNDRGQVLVTQRRDNGHWEPPGGVLELGETFEVGVCREVLEETGVQVEPVRLTGVYKNMNRGVVALVFQVKAVGGAPGPTEETTKVEWVDPQEVVARMDEAYAARVLDALEGPWPHVRVHDGVSLLPAGMP